MTTASQWFAHVRAFPAADVPGTPSPLGLLERIERSIAQHRQRKAERKRRPQATALSGCGV